MKYTTTLLFILSTYLLTAQVGIGTTNPLADLHIAGDLLVQNNFILGSLNTVNGTDEDFKLITRSTSSSPMGKLTKLDVNSLSIAPINVVDYSFTNISLDNLTDVDLQYDENKYVVGIANFRYTGDAIKKIDGGGTKSIGNFVVNTFTSGGTWHLEIRNRTLDLDLGDSVGYDITLIVYDISYFRNLTPITTDLNGRNNGNASSIPNLY